MPEIIPFPPSPGLGLTGAAKLLWVLPLPAHQQMEAASSLLAVELQDINQGLEQNTGRKEKGGGGGGIKSQLN